MTHGESEPSLQALTTEERYLLPVSQQVGLLGVNAEHYRIIVPVNYDLDRAA
jgi:uncharacterized protein